MNRLWTRAALCAAAVALVPAALAAQQTQPSAHGHGQHQGHGQHGAASTQRGQPGGHGGGLQRAQACGDMEIIGHGPLHIALEHGTEFSLSAGQMAGLDSLATKLRADLTAMRQAMHNSHMQARQAGQTMTPEAMQAAHRAMDLQATAFRRAADEAALARLTAEQRERITSSHPGEHAAPGAPHPACAMPAAGGQGGGHGPHGQH